MVYKRYNKGELAKEILFLVAAGIVIPASLVLPNLPLILKPLIKSLSRRKKTSQQSIVKSITYLKKERLVDAIEKGGMQILTLSEEGKRRVLRFNIEKIAINRPKKWDGFWRVIVFDVPEREREGRDALRTKLKKLGFYQLQKSCFVFPFHCKDEIDFITEFFYISKYVNLILAKSIEGEKYLMKFFDLY